MPAEATPALNTDDRRQVLLDADGRAREPLAAERAALSPEQVGEDDRLPSPRVDTPVVLAVGAGVLSFLLLVLGGLFLYFHAEVGRQTTPDFSRFPDPRLETNIDPRTLPAVERGGVEAKPPVVPEPSPAIMKQAMAAILARGAKAYDPLPDPHAPGPSGQTSQATPPAPIPPAKDGR